MSHLPQDLYAVLDHEIMVSHSKGAPWLCTETTSVLLTLDRSWCIFPSRWSARRSTSVCKHSQGDRESWLDSNGNTGRQHMAECCRLNPDFVQKAWGRASLNKAILFVAMHYKSFCFCVQFSCTPQFTVLSHRAASVSNVSNAFVPQPWRFCPSLAKQCSHFLKTIFF